MDWFIYLLLNANIGARTRTQLGRVRKQRRETRDPVCGSAK
jgi:hypothetical protein